MVRTFIGLGLTDPHGDGVGLVKVTIGLTLVGWVGGLVGVRIVA